MGELERLKAQIAREKSAREYREAVSRARGELRSERFNNSKAGKVLGVAKRIGSGLAVMGKGVSKSAKKSGFGLNPNFFSK
jgi:hypothetical protein